MPSKPFFFDIETGGLRASRNPVLSLATAGRQGEPAPRYAEPPKGATLSRWSEKKIWEPIKKSGRARTSEKALLMDFLTQLEGAPPDTQLVGWNIGYSTFPQGSTRAGGFDIPVLIERARQYGLDQRYRKALKRLTIRDEGAIWALRMAESVAGTTVGKRMVQEGRLQEEIWKEAVGYLKQAGRLAHEQGLKTEEEIAEALSREGIRFAGWKQESIFKLLFGHTNRGKELLDNAHEVNADVKMLRMVSQETRREFNEEFIERWGKEVLENKIVSSLKTVKPGGPARFQEAMQLAKQWGIEEGVTTKLRKLAADSDVSWRAIQAGRGIPQTERVIRGGLAAEAAERVGLGQFSELFEGIGRRHWGKIGLGLGALALVTLKPGNLFSGKDDEYNVIEGLPHGGVAQRMREMFTDFGSGWIRKALSKGIAPSRVKQAASTLGQLERWGGIVSKTRQGEEFLRLSRIGKGGLGAVFKVRSLSTGRMGVEKVLKGAEQENVLMEVLAGQGSKVISPRAAETIRKMYVAGDVGQTSFQQMFAPETGLVLKIKEGMRGSYRQVGEKLPIHFEAKIQQAAFKETPELVPEVFGLTKKGFIQELAGRAVKPEEYKEAAQFIEKVYKPMTEGQRRVLHFDPAIENLVRTPEGGFKLIDFGVASFTETMSKQKQAYEALVEESMRKAGRYVKMSPVPQVPISPATGVGRPRALAAKAENIPDISISKAKSILEETPLPSSPPLLEDRLRKLQALNQQGPVRPPPGPMTTASRKKIDGEWESPVNLNKAANKASKMYKTTPKSVASKQRSGIIEANNAKAKRQQRMQAHHRKAQIQHSSYSLRPGKRHRHQTGRLVT